MSAPTFEELMADKGNCQLLLTANHLRVQRFLGHGKDNGYRQNNIRRAKTEKRFRDFLGWQLSERAQYYWLREHSGELAGDDPIDIELFFLLLLYYAREFDKKEFPALYETLEKSRGIMQRTYNYRRDRLAALV